MDRKLVSSGLYEALEDADIEFRWRKKGPFRKVDRIRRAPDWEAHAWMRAVGPALDTSWHVVECGWCGDDFVTNKPAQECCSNACGGFLWRFRKRRQST